MYYNTAHYLPLIIRTVLKYNIFRTFVLNPGEYILRGDPMQTAIKKLIIEQLERCEDADLLDFILKLLIAEG